MPWNLWRWVLHTQSPFALENIKMLLLSLHLWLWNTFQCRNLSKSVLCNGNRKGSSLVRNKMIFYAYLSKNGHSFLFINMMSLTSIPVSLINIAKLTYHSQCFNEANSVWIDVNPRWSIRSSPQRVIKNRVCLVLPKTRRTAEYIMLQTQGTIIMWVTLGLFWQQRKCKIIKKKMHFSHPWL